MTEFSEEQLLDLLCKKAVTGLDSSEKKQLAELEKAFPEWKGDESFDLAASAINVLAIGNTEEMPTHLRSKIVSDSAQFFESKEEDLQPTFSFSRKKSIWQWLGWGVAAFACSALLVNVYLTRFQSPANVAENTSVQSPSPNLTEAQKREQLILTNKKFIKADISKADPKSPIEITGDVVWSNSEQKGYLRFRGLPVNDPKTSTYQLWIFDEAQDEKYPIDGGVFDINQDGETIIPIDAKINVMNPTLFAVTKEKPGGVVVSDRKGIVAVAKV